MKILLSSVPDAWNSANYIAGERMGSRARSVNQTNQSSLARNLAEVLVRPSC